jgi:hypothetical protein
MAVRREGSLAPHSGRCVEGGSRRQRSGSGSGEGFPLSHFETGVNLNDNVRIRKAKPVRKR